LTVDGHQYRVVPVDGGYEAQMLYQMGAREGSEWFPLNGEGYWSDQGAFSFGLITRRDVFDTEGAAASAIIKARAINAAPS
jgi:hypothetical protein